MVIASEEDHRNALTWKFDSSVISSGPKNCIGPCWLNKQNEHYTTLNQIERSNLCTNKKGNKNVKSEKERTYCVSIRVLHSPMASLLFEELELLPFQVHQRLGDDGRRLAVALLDVHQPDQRQSARLPLTVFVFCSFFVRFLFVLFVLFVFVRFLFVFVRVCNCRFLDFCSLVWGCGVHVRSFIYFTVVTNPTGCARLRTHAM